MVIKKIYFCNKLNYLDSNFFLTNRFFFLTNSKMLGLIVLTI